MSQGESRQAPSRYCAFGPYVIDLVRGSLWRDGVVVHLRPKDAEILTTLISLRDRVVEKQEIFERVWPGVFVEENNLARRICELRRALGEGAGQRTFVATFPARGYRFVAEVTELSELPWSSAPTKVGDPAAGERLAGAIGVAPPDISTGGQRFTWSRGVTVAILLALCAVVFAGIERYAPAIEGAPPVARQFSFGPELQQQPAWSPDGQYLAYAAVSSGISDIWVQRAPDAMPARITASSAHDWQPSWSPDGQWLAFRSERDGGGIWTVRRDGSQDRLLIGRGLSPQWSPDGRWILFSTGDGRPATAWPHVVNVSDGTVLPLLQDVLTSANNKYAAWHPDGRASVWFRDAAGSWRFVTAPVAGSSIVESAISADVERGLTNAGIRLRGLEFPFDRLEQFVWAPSGRHLYFEVLTGGARGIWRITVDPDTLAWRKGPEPITTGIGHHAQIALSPDGETMAFAAQAARTRVWAIPLGDSEDAARGEPLTPGREHEVYARTTADGRVLVYRSVQGSRNEFRYRQDGNSARDRILVSGIDRNALQLSPDGLRVVYTRYGENGPNYQTGSKLVTLPLGGGDERTLFDSPRMRFSPTDWSRDGELLLGRCAAKSGGPWSICTLPVNGERMTENALDVVVSPRAADSELRAATFSPDRRWIAFTEASRAAPASSTIYLVPADGGPWRAVVAGEVINDRARWAPDGRTLYFLSNRRGGLNVWGQSLDADGHLHGDPFQVTSFTDPQTYIPYGIETSILVTGTHLLVPVAELRANIWILPGLGR